VHKGNWFEGFYFSHVKVEYYDFPLGGLVWVGVGCLQLRVFFFFGGGGSLLVPSSCSFLYSGYFWVGEVHWMYSIVQNFERVEEGKVG
jgi:hypothetical protein